jgi:hypothetical protein
VSEGKRTPHSALKPHQAMVDQEPGKTREHMMARAVHEPLIRHAAASAGFGGAGFEDQSPSVTDSMDVLKGACEKVREGELKLPVDTLTLQALTLDTVFTDMARRASANMGQFPEAADMYMRLALKAQAQSRATIEALAKIVRGNEQVVKHVYVDNRGGQAVITDTVTTKGGRNHNADAQSHGPIVNDALGTPLLGQDKAWHGVQLPGNAREEAVPAARRQGRSAAG